MSAVEPNEANLVERHLADGARAVAFSGRVADHGIVVDDQMAVGGAVHVEFDAVGALLDGQCECRQRVFAALARSAAMRDDVGNVHA